MGECGIDLVLSEAARKFFPFAMEARNQEAVNVWAAIRGSEANAKKEQLLPIATIRRNHTKPYAVVDFEIFLGLVSLAYDWARTDLKQALVTRMAELEDDGDSEVPGDDGVPGRSVSTLRESTPAPA